MVMVMQVAVLLTLLLLSCPAQFAGGQGVVCESNGHCEETSGACVNDKMTECLRIQHHNKIDATYEDLYGVTKAVSGSSPTPCKHSSAGFTNMSLESLELDYVYENSKYVSVCASWNLASTSGHNGGFAVKFLRHSPNGGVRYNVCIQNPTVRRLCFNGWEYANLYKREYYIQVYPFPYPADTDVSVIRKTKKVQSALVGCADVEHNTSTCYRHYHRPEKVSVASCIHENGKDLTVTWQLPSGAEVPPETYYLTLYNNSDYSQRKYFRVNDSLQLTVRNLSASFNYSVELQAYRRCMGVGDYFIAPHSLGCGVIASPVDEILTKCDKLTTPTLLLDSTVSVVFSEPALRQKDPSARTHLYATIGGIGGGIGGVMLVIIGIAIIFSVYFVCRLRRVSYSNVYPKSLQKSKVFVFYAPSMTDSRLKIVQERIVCILRDYFDVVTPNDISSGNISIWLEESIKSVDSTFLVGNKEFFCDWNKSKEERPPVMNSLELLISSAAAQDSISRFAFVSAEDNIQDVFIPDNSYLKVMPVFLLGQKTHDMDKLYQFVTKSRGIELRTDTQH